MIVLRKSRDMCLGPVHELNSLPCADVYILATLGWHGTRPLSKDRTAWKCVPLPANYWDPPNWFSVVDMPHKYYYIDNNLHLLHVNCAIITLIPPSTDIYSKRILQHLPRKCIPRYLSNPSYALPVMNLF